MIYTDLNMESYVIRTFDDSIDPTELKWHRDDEDRAVISVSSTDWKIQLENSLPQSLDSVVFIERGQWHRLIKGTGELRVKIVKSNGFDK
jgi:hypothetical protein